jgi:excisionase family DNA binding protein
MELLASKDVSEILGVGPDRVRQLADEGRLPYVRTKSGWRVYRKEDVERLAAERDAWEAANAKGADRNLKTEDQGASTDKDSHQDR